VWDFYKSKLTGTCISIGEVIDDARYGQTLLHPRISPWFWLFDIQTMRAKGIHTFRGEGCTDWTYDTGSWFWEKMRERGFTNWDIDKHESSLGKDYGQFFHYGQLSCNTTGRGPFQCALTGEVVNRRAHVKERLATYKNVFLEDKFIGPNEMWSDQFTDIQVAKGWWPL
jgi:hypothetical protein